MFGLHAHERVTVTDRTTKNKRAVSIANFGPSGGRHLAIGVPSAIGFL